MRLKSRLLMLALITAFTVSMVNKPLPVNATELTEGYNPADSLYYVKEDGKLIKASGVVKVDQDYLYFEDGVMQADFSGLKKIKDDDSFELYYIEAGKAVINDWRTATEKKGDFTYYFGSDAKAYKADSISGFRTTKVVLKKVDGKQYGFDENGHQAKGLWATDSKLVFFNKKTGVYDKKKSKALQKIVKRGKKSTKLAGTVKKKFGKPVRIKTTSSCNPFDMSPDASINDSMLKRYKGYNYYYKNIVISMTKNTSTGVYYMDGAGPIDLD